MPRLLTRHKHFIIINLKKYFSRHEHDILRACVLERSVERGPVTGEIGAI